MTPPRRPRTVVALGMSAAALAAATAAPAVAAPPAYDQMTFVAGSSTGAPVAGSALSSPLGIVKAGVADAQGNLYLGDYGNSLIEKITQSGQLSVIAGNGTTSNWATDGAATATPMNQPSALAVDSQGNVYIGSTRSYGIARVSPSGQLHILEGRSPLAGLPTVGPVASSSAGRVNSIAIDDHDNIYYFDRAAFSVYKIDPQGNQTLVAGTGTGAVGNSTPGPATSSTLTGVYGIVTRPNGDIYLAQNTQVDKVDASGQLTHVAGTGVAGAPTPGLASASQLQSINAMAGVGDDLYLTSSSDGRVIKISDGQLSYVAGTGTVGATVEGPPLSSPTGGVALFAGPDGELYTDDIYYGPHLSRIGWRTPSAPYDVTADLGRTTGTLSFRPPRLPGTSTLTGYEVSLDGGATWQTLATSPGTGDLLTGSLADLTPGRDYDPVVRARNAIGAGPSAPAPHATTLAPAPAATTSTTEDAAPTPTPAATQTPQRGAVRLGEQAAKAGLKVTSAGAIAIPLTCAVGPTGCDADGVLSLSAPAGTARAARETILARFSGVRIAAGQGKLVSVRLSRARLRALQRRGVRRVRVTLRTTDHLTGQAPVVTVQHVWLGIPGRVCSTQRTVKVRWVLPRGVVAKAIVVTVDGKVVVRPATTAGTATVRLGATGSKAALVRVIATTSTGAKLTTQRLRRLCGAKRPAGYRPTRTIVLKPAR